MADMAIGTWNEELASPMNVLGDSAGDWTLFGAEAAFGDVAPASLADGFWATAPASVVAGFCEVTPASLVEGFWDATPALVDGFSEVAPASLIERLWGMAPDSVGTPFWPVAGIAVGVETMTWLLRAVLVTGDPTTAGTVSNVTSPLAAVRGMTILTGVPTTPVTPVLGMTVLAGGPTTPVTPVPGMTVLAGGLTTPVTPVAGGCAKLIVEFAKTTGTPGRNGPLDMVLIGVPVAVGVTGTRGQVGHGLVMTTVVLLPVPVGMGHVGHGAVAVTTVVLPTF